MVAVAGALESLTVVMATWIVSSSEANAVCGEVPALLSSTSVPSCTSVTETLAAAAPRSSRVSAGVSVVMPGGVSRASVPVAARSAVVSMPASRLQAARATVPASRAARNRCLDVMLRLLCGLIVDSRDPEDLAGLDQVRVVKLVAVGVGDLLPAVCAAVVLFGDGGERFALFARVGAIAA